MHEVVSRASGNPRKARFSTVHRRLCVASAILLWPLAGCLNSPPTAQQKRADNQDSFCDPLNGALYRGIAEQLGDVLAPVFTERTVEEIKPVLGRLSPSVSAAVVGIGNHLVKQWPEKVGALDPIFWNVATRFGGGSVFTVELSQAGFSGVSNPRFHLRFVVDRRADPPLLVPTERYLVEGTTLHACDEWGGTNNVVASRLLTDPFHRRLQLSYHPDLNQYSDFNVGSLHGVSHNLFEATSTPHLTRLKKKAFNMIRPAHPGYKENTYFHTPTVFRDMQPLRPMDMVDLYLNNPEVVYDLSPLVAYDLDRPQTEFLQTLQVHNVRGLVLPDQLRVDRLILSRETLAIVSRVSASLSAKRVEVLGLHLDDTTAAALNTLLVNTGAQKLYISCASGVCDGNKLASTLDQVSLRELRILRGAVDWTTGGSVEDLDRLGTLVKVDLGCTQVVSGVPQTGQVSYEGVRNLLTKLPVVSWFEAQFSLEWRQERALENVGRKVGQFHLVKAACPSQ